MNFVKNLFKKRSTKEYGFEIKNFEIKNLGQIEYAQWKHPLEQTKVIDNSIINFYKQFVKSDDFVIDIGAHTGDTTVPIALCAGKNGLVLALEPNKFVYKILKKNSSLNSDFTNIHPVNYAATSEDGFYIFNYSDESFCNGGYFDKISNKNHGHAYKLEVEGINLEKYLESNYKNLLPKLSLIKIDAEGYDKEIIKSLSSIIKIYKPFIITECNVNLTDEERFELFNVLKLFNYTLIQIDDDFDSKTVKEIKSKEEMLRAKHFDIIAKPI